MDANSYEKVQKDKFSIDEDKVNRIQTACSSRDIDVLVSLASSHGGFINDDLRGIAWPVLLGVDDHASTRTRVSWADLPSHRDEQQVKLDVDRSFIYYPHNESEKSLEALKQDLFELITGTLRQHPFLCYPQGYHDILQVVLLVLGKERATLAVERLSLLRVRDFLQPTITPTIAHLRLLLPLLRLADPDVERQVSQNDPAFALAATLTLYAHNVERYGDIARLFDFILATEAAMPVYLFAAVMITRRAELFEFEPDAPEMLSILQKLPDPLDVEDLISQAQKLFNQYPPEKLPGRVWHSVSSYSVLKTTRNAGELTRQTLEDGQRFFEKHAAQIRLAQRVSEVQTRLWRARRPAGAVGAAFLVAYLAWSMRGENISGVLPTMWQRFKFFMW